MADGLGLEVGLLGKVDAVVAEDWYLASPIWIQIMSSKDDGIRS